MKFKVVLYESEEGFAVGCPTLPGCWSQGDTLEEALENIQIGIREFLEATWVELKKSIAEDLAEGDDLRVTFEEVEVDLDGVEDAEPQEIGAVSV